MQDKFVILPVRVCFDKSLTPLARLLYGLIASLSTKDGFCWARNSFFAERFGVNQATISRAIAALAQGKYIRLEFEGAGNEIRRIYTLDEKVKGYDEKIKAPCEKSQGPIDEKVKQIITSDKNKNICAFAQFWEAYPKKRDKARARKAFDKLSPDQALLDQILSSLAWQTKSADWTKDGGQYIPLASTYINGRRWEDEPPANALASKPRAPKLRTIVDSAGNEVCVIDE